MMIALTSCDGLTTYEKIVVNDSSDTLEIFVYSSYKVADSSRHTIDPGKMATIFYDDNLGGNSNPQPCLVQFDSIKVLLPEEKILSKNINEEGNWELSITSKRRGALVDQVCTYRVSVDDIIERRD
jgi:hypothetical protein